MESVVCTRRIEFCAGHRVVGHEGKCRNWHGHNYVLEVTARAKQSLDSVGRVIDFSVLKDRVKGWIDANWDHGMILWNKDVELLAVSRKVTGDMKTYALPTNPTAENMAAYLMREVFPRLFADTRVDIVKAVLHETPNCYATVERID